MTNPIKASMKPIIYSESNFVTFENGESKSIIWYIIDDDPFEYFITVNNSLGGEDFLQQRNTIIHSKIEFVPIGLPTGYYSISLYVTDYSGFETKMVIHANITRVIFTSSVFTSTETTEPAASATFGYYIFLTLLTLGVIKLKLKKKRRI